MNVIQWIGVGLVPAVLVILAGLLVRRLGQPATSGKRFLVYLLAVELLLLLAAGAAWMLAGGSRVSFQVTTSLAGALIGVLILLLLGLEAWDGWTTAERSLALGFGLILTGALAIAWSASSNSLSLVLFGLLVLAAVWLLTSQATTVRAGSKSPAFERSPSLAVPELVGADRTESVQAAVTGLIGAAGPAAAQPGGSRPHLVLVHSPLVGPLTWSRVGDELRRRGYPVLIPELSDAGDPSEPYWKRQSASAARALAGVTEAPIILVAHSGAGPLLPAIAAALPNPVRAYVFVDAGIPVNGHSYLDLMRSESAEVGAEFQDLLESGQTYPNWHASDLAEILPDPSLRQAMLDQVQPRSLDYFTTPLPVGENWPDAPCAYLQLSDSYESYARTAQARGWPLHKIPAGHFHMLVDPPAVTQAILDLVEAV